MIGILGKKLGMTQVFQPDGTCIPVTVVEAGRTFKILSQNDLGEALAASPAISNGTIYLRTFDALWAIRAK